MKKIVIAIILFCTLYSAYCLDYRQVIFGNSYQNIIEIDADSFFEQYPAIKENDYIQRSAKNIFAMQGLYKNSLRPYNKDIKLSEVLS